MRKIKFYLLLLLLLSSCINKNNPVVLQVGDLDIRQDELNRAFNRFSLQNRDMGGKKITKSAFDKWIDNFKDDLLLEDKARASGYNENTKEIKLAQSALMKYIIAQYQGPYYKETISNRVTASNEERAEALEKVKYEYTFEVLKFSDKDQLSSILGPDTLCTNHADFIRVKNKAKKAGVNSKEVKAMWPFMQLPGIRDILYELKPGMVTSGPVKVFDTPYKDAYCIIYLRSEEPIAEILNNPPPEERMTPVVREYKKLIMFYTKLRDFYKSSEFRINYSLVDSLFQQITYTPVLNKIDTNNISLLLNQQILTYKINNMSVVVTIRDFIAFYNNLPMRTKIKDSRDMAEFIQDMVIFDYMWEEAQQSGYTSREFFTNSQQYHLRRNIIKVYLENEVYPGTNFSEEEMEKYYNDNILNFTSAEYVIYNKCIFIDMKHARQCEDVLLNTGPDNAILMLKDTSRIKGLISCEELQELRYDSEKYPSHIIRQLSRLQRGQVTRSFISDGKSTILIKIGERGTHVETYSEVKDRLHNSLFFEKRKSAKNELVADLKNNCEIVNKVDYKKFVTEYISVSISPDRKENENR